MTEKCLWNEAMLPDGRRYYYNQSTGESSWEKPDTYIPHGGSTPINSIMSASAIIKQHMSSTSTTTANLSNTDISASWREMTNATGKKYYYNTLTKVSVWEMPAEYREYLTKQRDPALVSKENGEQIFFKMLRDHNITSKWSWEETLREVINDSKYKCIPTLAERKAAFAIYIEQQNVVEKEEDEKKKKQAMEGFMQLLANAEKKKIINGETRFADATNIFDRDKKWTALTDEREKEHVYNNFMIELRKKEDEELVIKRKFGTWKFIQLLREESDLNDPNVTWKEAIIIFTSMKAFDDPDIASLQPIDFLILFEDHVKRLEYFSDRKKQLERIEKEHSRLKAIDDLRNLLDSLIADGTFTAMTGWPELFPFIKDQLKFILPAAPGASTPLDYYWDKLDQLQQAYLPDRKSIFDHLEANFGIIQQWTVKDLEQMMQDLEQMNIPIESESSTLQSITKHKAIVLRELHYHYSLLLQQQNHDNNIDITILKQQYRLSIDRYKKALKKLGQLDLHSNYNDYKYRLYNAEFDANSTTKDRLPEILKIIYFTKYIAHLKKKFGGVDNENAVNQEIITEDNNIVQESNHQELEREEGEVAEDQHYRSKRKIVNNR